MKLLPLMQWDGEGNGNPLQYSCLENPMDRGAWWAAVHGITKSDTTEQLHFHFSLFTHSSVLAWRIPGMKEPGGLPSMGSHRVGHDWSDLAAAAQYSCLENSLDRRGWWVTIHRVTKSPTEWLTLSLRFNYLQLNYNQIKSPLSWNNSTPLIINRPRLEWDWDPCLPQ